MLCVRESDLHGSHSPIFKTLHTSKPLREQIWLLLSGGSLMQLLHLTRFLGRDRGGQSHEFVNVTTWKESSGNVRMFFGSELIFGRALFKFSSVSCRADSKMGYGWKSSYESNTVSPSGPEQTHSKREKNLNASTAKIVRIHHKCYAWRTLQNMQNIASGCVIRSEWYKS